MKNTNMPKLTLHKERGLSLALFFVLLVFNHTNCYSDIIVPKLDGSTGKSDAWTLKNLSTGSGCWIMNNSSSSVETKEFYDFTAFTGVTIQIKLGTYFSVDLCKTRLEISDDGINWKLLNEFPLTESESKTAKTFSYPAASLPNKHAKIRLIAANSDNTAGAKLFSLEITGTPKFIPIPTSNEATNITTRSFTANWNNCNNATDYEINIYNKLPGKAEKTILYEDFSEQNPKSSAVDTELSTLLPKWKGKLLYFYASATENQKFLKVGNTSTKGSYIELPPLNLSEDNGKFKLDFDIGTLNTAPCDVYLSINNEKVETITINTTSLYTSLHKTYSFSNGTENCIIRLEGVTKDRYSFILDNIKITQLQNGVETSIAGYPKNVENQTSYAVEGLAPNTTYYYKVKATNGYITTHQSNEICAKTLSGDQIIVESNEEKIFNNETINGNLQIKEGAKISGKVTVTGEILYTCKFTPGKWHSFSLPFIPKNVGGYINGKAYSLRANHDYMLKSYENEKFTDAILSDKGYIIKVPANIDNGELFFFSDKGITLNESTPQYAISNGYTHLGNPYTYSISPRELVAADKYYCLKNNKYIESNDNILPYQSFIAYKEIMPNLSVSAIYTDPQLESTGITNAESDNIKIWQDNGTLHITGTEETVSIYSTQGKVAYTGSTEALKQIMLTPGLYLIKIKNQTTKIIIN
jgi:hypothetical protein